jgi:hypothetical protein
MEQQLRPWIKPGEDAFEALSRAILEGDRSGFETSPGYEFRLKQGEEAIMRARNAGLIPTAGAVESFIGHGQGLATQEWSNYLGQLGGLAQSGYSSLMDLKSLEAHYMGAQASMKSAEIQNEYNRSALEAQLMISGGKAGGSAIGSGLSMLAGGISGGMGGMSSMGGGGGMGQMGGTGAGGQMGGLGTTVGNIWQGASSQSAQGGGWSWGGFGQGMLGQ